jgi:hypothetical protein
MATPNYLNNFTDAALFIASTLNITLLNTSSKRNISKTSTLGHQNRNSGWKNKKKLTRHYTAEEWKALTEEERQEIRNARNAKKNARDKSGKKKLSRINKIQKGMLLALLERLMVTKVNLKLRYTKAMLPKYHVKKESRVLALTMRETI